MLDSETRNKLLSLKKQSDERKVWGDPTLTRRQAALLLQNALPTGGQINCWNAMSNDLNSMCIYEIVHYWCNPDIGLGTIFPKEVIQVCEFILANKIEQNQ